MSRRPPSKRQSSTRRDGSSVTGSLRLQRLLASAGFGSRRQCEDLIEMGRVDVDGQVVTKLGTTVDPSTQKIRVDGAPLKKQKLVYYAVNKPTGVVTTNRDPQGRPRVVDLVPPVERVFPVGRLDRSSEGLILLTNDGELAQKLTHPKFGVRKVYRVTVAGRVDNETMKKMRQGIYIAEGFVKVEGAKLLRTRGRATEMEITLREGKNREIRRILASLGHKVQQLRRIAVGPLRLGEIPPGAYRIVSPDEVEKLWAATESSAETDESKGRFKPRGSKSQGSVRSKSQGSVRSKSQGSVRRQAKRGDNPSGGSRSVKVASGRPYKKKSRAASVKPGEMPLSFGESRTAGIIIGAEPTPQRRAKKKSKGSTQRSTKPTSKRQSRGPAKRQSIGQSKHQASRKPRGNTTRTKRKD